MKGTTIPSKVEEVIMFAQQLDELQHELRTDLLKAQDHMQIHANKHRRPLVFQVGDMVNLKQP